MKKDEEKDRLSDALKAGKIATCHCCFCHKGVPVKEACAVVVIKKWGHPQKDQAAQQWFCHLACFEKTTGEVFEAQS